MNQFFSLCRRALNSRKPSASRKAAHQRGFRPGLELLERRDTPTTFLSVVTTNPAIVLGQVDALSVTVNGNQEQGSAVQFGVKLTNNANPLPPNTTPDFYALCVDVTRGAKIGTTPYPVTESPSSTLNNGPAIAYLYNTNTNNGQLLLDKTHVAGLQLAMWEEEYGPGIVTGSDLTFMMSFNGATETANILTDAAVYLAGVPSNPTATATVFKDASLPASQQGQDLIGPTQTPVQPQIAITKTPDSPTITPGQLAGFTVTITNTGTVTDTGVTLSDPLPAGGTPPINWMIDGSRGTPTDFTISGAAGSQNLVLSPSFVSAGDSLAPGQAIVVHITGLTNASTTGTTSANVGLGAAGGYTVLYTGGHNLQITNVTVNGNVGVGGSGHVQFNGPGVIGGRLDFSAPNTGQYANNNGANVGPTSVNYNVSGVTAALAAASNLNSSLAELGTPIAINGNQTINESASTVTATVNGVTYKVFNVSSYHEGDGNMLTINGDGSGDPVAFNFGQNSNTQFGGDVTLTGGLTEDQVLWNVTSSGQNVSLNNNASSFKPSQGFAFRGIINAPNDNISVVNTSMVGRVWGGNNGDMQIVSGDTIKTPPGKLVNTATVSADNVTATSATATVTL